MELNSLFKAAVESTYVDEDLYLPLYRVCKGRTGEISLECLKGHPDWLEVGDCLFVEDKKFILEARNRAGELVFVSEKLLGMSTMNDIDTFLKSLEREFPDELLSAISPCEHQAGDKSGESGITNGRKLWIPSYYNVKDYGYSGGKDDVLFERMSNMNDRARRLENRAKRLENGEREWYWLDTLYMSNPKNSWIVYASGSLNNSYANYSNGVCVAFSI